jgi:segregation and condensation protein B
MMSDVQSLPALKQILGALVFGANRPLDLKEIWACIVEVADTDPEAAVFRDVTQKQLGEAVEELKADLSRVHAGFTVHEVAGGFRLQSDAACGRWLKHLLKTKPQRLSQPALETMAIIAYRQPISKADIETIRGVSVAHIIKGLMEMQLVRISGRSELPGRPFLYGTTHLFLEHFGLKDLKELDRMAPRVLSRKAAKEGTAPGIEEPLFEGDSGVAEGRSILENDPRQIALDFKEDDGVSVEASGGEPPEDSATLSEDLGEPSGGEGVPE